LVPIGALFPEAGEAGMAVFRDLFVVDVAHPLGLLDESGNAIRPTVGEICRPWIMDIATAIHGAYDVESGERLIREVLIKVPKKNWKSGLAAMLMLSLLVLNWRDSNEAGIVAPTKDTADNVFKPMRDAIKADPELSALFHVLPTQRTIRHRTTGMECRVYAADTETVSGKKWAFVIFEELWQLSKRNGAVDMVLECTGGQASRPEGIVISITTESDEEPVGVYKAKLEFARAVRDGFVHAPHFLPILYEWPKAEIKARAYLDPKKFHLVNPNYGASVDPIDFNRKFSEAMTAGGESLRVFLAKRLNVPPSENMGGSWAGAEYWNACAEPGLTLEKILERSDVVTVGIDGGGLDDMLGFAAIGRDAESGDWLLWTRAWVHPIALERNKSEAEAWKEFVAEGSLKITEQMGDEIEEVAGYVDQIEKSGLLDRVGVDPAGIGAIVDAIVGKDIEHERIVGIPQGWKLNGSIKTFERKLAAGEIAHAGTALMRYSVTKARTKKAGNAIYITREESGAGKVDPLLASLNAGALMAMNPQPRRKAFQMFVM
jgi:phage terminase large subunit-like protein